MRIAAPITVMFAARLAAAQATPAPQTARPEVIRGVVTTDSGKVVARATVIATMAPDRFSQQTISATDGRYEIKFEAGNADYLVYATAEGFRPFRRRIALTAASATLVLDVRLVRLPSEAQQLAAVRIAATRKQRPIPDVAGQPDPAAVESYAETLPGILSPDQIGDMLAMAATVPGVVVGADGQLIVSGTSGQISTTVNGMASDATHVPSDMIARVMVSTSSWDPAVGGFGGARVNLQVANGGPPFTYSFFTRVGLDAPALQYNSPLSRQLGGGLTRFDISANGAGPLIEDKWFYNFGIEGIRRSNGSPIFSNAPQSVLSLVGLSADSAARARQLLTSLGIPFAAGGVPSEQISQNVAMTIWLGYIPGIVSVRNRVAATRPMTNAYITGTLNASNSEGPAGLAATPASATMGRSVAGNLTASGFHYHNDYAVSDLQTSFGFSSSRSSPYLQMPGGTVRIESLLPDGSSAIGSIGFGGGSQQLTRNHASWETAGSTQFYLGSAHRIKLYAESHLEWLTQTSAQGTNGVFAFNSLADLAANRPSTFTRALTAPSATASEFAGAFGIGDFWQVSPTLKLESTLRVDGNHFGNRPGYNPAVAQQFALSTMNVPNTFDLEPRVGFVWQYGAASQRGNFLQSPIGQITTPPRGVISGGIGEFRNIIPLGAVSSAFVNTGLAGAADRLLCVGAAAPTPAWSSYEASPASIPTSCAGGASSLFTDAAPSVQLYDRTFNAPRSWKGVLQWASANKYVRFNVNASYVLNLDQVDATNANFTGVPTFALANEGNRPVFVSPSSIYPATGSLTTLESRRSTAFGSVMDLQSDLQSTSKALTITLVPELPVRSMLLSVSYTLGEVRDQSRGFVSNTFGSPADLQSGRGNLDVRHAINIMTGYAITKSLYLTSLLMVRSGMPYTPLIAGDVNGDGQSNDRAFVFDPAKAANASLANGMNTLMAAAPSLARSCLESQLGAAAGRNSCEGPWTASMSASIVSKYYKAFDGRLFRYSVSFSNLLGGIDELLHGDNHLQGWGMNVRPDPFLYYVRGFDPAAKQFQYDVNPRFGSTRPSQTALRAPFRVTLDFRMELGAPQERQTVQRVLNAGRNGRAGKKMSADSIRDVYESSVSDIYANLIFQRDSLLLTVSQVAAIQNAQARYKLRVDSAWAGFGDWVIAQGDDYDAKAIVRKLDEKYEMTYAIARGELDVIRKILTPLQLSLTYGPVGDMLAGRTRSPGRSIVMR